MRKIDAVSLKVALGAILLSFLFASCKSTTVDEKSSEAQASSSDRKSAFYTISEKLEPSHMKTAMISTLDHHFIEIQEKIDEAAVEISTLSGMSTWEKIDLAVDLYGRLLSFFVKIELPVMASLYEVDHNRLLPAVTLKVMDMKEAFKSVLVGTFSGKHRFLVDYNSLPGFKRFTQMFRLALPSPSKGESLNLASDTPSSNPPLTLEDLLNQPKPGPLTPEISMDVNAEAKSFRESFNKIVPNSLIISSMLIGTAVAVIVTVATLNPAVGGGVGVATGFGILAFVGGSYGIMKTIETYKAEDHAPAPN